MIRIVRPKRDLQ